MVGSTRQADFLGDLASRPPRSGPFLVAAVTAAMLATGSGLARAGDGELDPLRSRVTDFNNSYHFERPLAYAVVRPYRDDSFHYGYYDHVRGRGPVVTLGDRTLLPGFRGYGLFGSPGYGPGLRPTSLIDLSRYRERPAPAAHSRRPPQ